MPLDFPSSPTVGQQYLNWTWNGVAWVVTAAQPVPFYNNSGRNFVDNALFNIQQRGTGPWNTSGVYTADRWGIYSGGSDTVAASIVALNDGNRTTIGDESAEFGLICSFTGAAVASSFVLFAQPIEDVRRLAGKTVTVSFFAGASSVPINVGVSVDQNFGTGGSPSASVFGNGQSVQITAANSWARRFSLTFNIPSIIGKTLGTNANTSSTSVNFWLSSGATNTVRAGNVGVQTGNVGLWGVQVEVGSQATPLEKLVPEVDLARCQRFYQSLGAFGLNGIATAGGQTVSMYLTYPVMMRAAPTVVNGFSSFTNVLGASQTISTNAAAAYIYYLSNAAGVTNAQVANPAFNISADL